MRPIFFVSELLHIASALADSEDAGHLPVEHWHPEHCGAMDLVIKSDGTWVHEGVPMRKPQLVRLLSRVLRHDTEGYVLVTPAEKISITVEDVPFLIVEADYDSKNLSVRTNVEDRVDVGQDHPLTMRKGPNDLLLPYVTIRGALLARFNRASWFSLVDMASQDQENGIHITSGGITYTLEDGGAYS